MTELLTSLDVVNQSFKRSFHGYDAAEVDEFLDHVAETLQTYNQKNKELERELSAKNDSLAEFERMKDALHETLLMAQKSANDRVESARAQAESILNDARQNADDITRDAQEEMEQLRGEIRDIRDLRDKYAQEFRGILARFDTQLNSVLNTSRFSGAVADAVDSPSTGRSDSSSYDAAPAEPATKSDRRDIEAACGMFGVNPQDLMGPSGNSGK